MKIVDYKILRAMNDAALSAAVKARLKDGWELYGTPFVVPGPAGKDVEQILYQAMVKSE